MSNKKTLKMTKKTRGKSRKGGFFELFKDKDNDYNGQCNPNNLNNLTSTYDIKKKIDTCCPKSWYGRKNNSPYCKELNQKYDTATTDYFIRMNKSNANGVITDENDLRPSDVAYLTSSLQQNNTVGPSQINCKDETLAKSLTSENKIQDYIKTCECNKSRWNPFSNKRKNCGIVNKKLKELQEKENFDNRATGIVNKPFNQSVSETDSESDDEDDELPPVNMVKRDPYRPYSIDDDDPDLDDYRTHQVLTGNKPAYGYGGKKRRTKKHFRKRSIGKRSIGKRSIGKRSIGKQNIGKRSIRNQKRRKSRKH